MLSSPSTLFEGTGLVSRFRGLTRWVRFLCVAFQLDWQHGGCPVSWVAHWRPEMQTHMGDLVLVAVGTCQRRLRLSTVVLLLFATLGFNLSW